MGLWKPDQFLSHWLDKRSTKSLNAGQNDLQNKCVPKSTDSHYLKRNLRINLLHILKSKKNRTQTNYTSNLKNHLISTKKKWCQETNPGYDLPPAEIQLAVWKFMRSYQNADNITRTRYEHRPVAGGTRVQAGVTVVAGEAAQHRN